MKYNMTHIIIDGSENFVERVVENWSGIKPYLKDFEKVRIYEDEYLKADAGIKFSIKEEEVYIACDDPNPENIKVLKSLIEAQSKVRKTYKDQILLITRIHGGQISSMMEDEAFNEFVKEVYSEFMANFLPALWMSLERALALDELGLEDRNSLKKMEYMKEPFKEALKSLSKYNLYLAIADNIWRIELGLKIPDFISSSGVDVEGLKEVFKEVLNTLKTKDYRRWKNAAQAITLFTLKIFGVKFDGGNSSKLPKLPI
jgi:hypothetical protein